LSKIYINYKLNGYLKRKLDVDVLLNYNKYIYLFIIDNIIIYI